MTPASASTSEKEAPSAPPDAKKLQGKELEDAKDTKAKAKAERLRREAEELEEEQKKYDSRSEAEKEIDEKEVMENNPDEDVEEDYTRHVDDSQLSYFELAKKYVGKKELPPVDHDKIEYMPFKKNFYIECKEITGLKPHEVEAVRKTEGDIKVPGKYCPKPIKTFFQAGLSDTICKVLERREFEKPFPIQMQAIPALMCGRDVIGIAETGSGKTLAFLLPLFRHILDQPPLRNEDGPIGLIIGPTRELCQQITGEVGKFSKHVNLRMVACYGGSSLGEQLSQLKRGTEMLVATPGRLIDVLTISSGKVTNLRRVTYLVVDDADRMFDMGFEQQIAGVLRNVRPDRQVALFSATMPPHIQGLAKKLLHKPIEVTVGE